MVKKMTFGGICTAVALVMGANADTHVIGSIVVPNGTNGVNGTNGNDGLSAYQIWLNNGGSGTETEFLASLVGATGAAGTNGTNCEPTFSSAHDATNKKTVVTISGCGSTSTVDIPDGQDGNDGAPGTNGTNCEPIFSSAHDATNKKTVVTISGCGSTSTVDIPDGQDGQDGAPGTNGVGICDNVANPATAVKTYTKTYTAPTATKAGYVRLAQTMCNDTTNSTDYEDTCVPIVSSNKDICSGNGGMYMECVRQDTSAVYNICRSITTQNASAISTAIDAAQSAAETYADSVVANKVTSSDVNSAISTALSDYDTSTQVSNKITAATSDKVTNSALNTTLGSYLQTANLGTALKDTALKDDVASAVSASGALSGYLTSANAAETYATQSSVAGKQDALTTAQLVAVNSGITSNKITTYDGYATTIANKADASALSGYVKTDGSNLPATVVQTTNGKINAGVLPTTVVQTTDGKISAGVLPTTVVQTTNGKISAGVLPTTVVQTTDGKINSDVLPSNVTTDDNLKAQLLDSNLFGTCVVDTTQDTASTTCTSGSVMEAIYTQLEATIRAAH